MPPKKEQMKDNESLSAVIVVDSFDPRFSPLTINRPWCLYPICNVPIINYTLSWIARTEVKKILLVVTERNLQSLEAVGRNWNSCFESISIVSCKNAMSIGDALREVDARGLLTGDFLLISNPATFTSSTLEQQIAAFRKRRSESKDNVMTLIYSDLNVDQNPVIGIEKKTKKLMIFHKQDDPSQLDIDKPHFIGEAVIRRDIVDSGIAICSLNISAQFSDNFDFQHRDDVIREILVNEEILLQNIHVEVLPPFEAAFCVTDYDSLLLMNRLLMERWFHPMTLENMNCDVHFSALPGNVYLQINEAELGRLAPCRGAPKQSHNVTIGSECRIDEAVSVSCSSIGKGTQIGENTRIINCIIGEKCVIGSDCFIEDSVLGNDVRLPNGVHLQKQSVISEQVNYPGDLDVPENSAVCSTTPHEDFEELVKCKKTGDVFIWSLANGEPFWNARRPADSGNGSMGDGEESVEGTESEVGEAPELEAAAQFYEEVVESMERIQGFTFSDQQMHNLILEINSSKLAYNISMEDVAKHVFLAFLSLPGNETWTGLKELCTKWKLLFKNYYKPKKSQVQLLLAIEDRYKESTAEFGPMVTRLVHFLYNDLDVIEEEAILEWAESLDQSSELRRIMKPIVDWLQEDSEEEDEDSEED